MDIKAIAALVLLLAPASLLGQDAPSASPSASAGPIVGVGGPVMPASGLIPLLPDPPAGWSADKPEGSTSLTGGYALTSVSRTYVRGDADDAPTATVHIIDSANNQQFQAVTKAMWGATSNTPAGYDKAVTVAGLPGFEHFANADQTGVLWVVAAGRFFVQVETTKQTAPELEAWMMRVDLKKLSGLQ